MIILKGTSTWKTVVKFKDCFNKYNVKPADFSHFILDFEPCEKYLKWADNAAYSTYFYNVNDLFKIKDTIPDAEYFETYRLVYKIRD